jgi:hypothetical protein
MHIFFVGMININHFGAISSKFKNYLYILSFFLFCLLLKFDSVDFTFSNDAFNCAAVFVCIFN